VLCIVADKVVTDWWDYTIKVRSKEIKMLLEQGLISEDELRGKKFHTELPEIAVGSRSELGEKWRQMTFLRK